MKIFILVSCLLGNSLFFTMLIRESGFPGVQVFTGFLRSPFSSCLQSTASAALENWTLFSMSRDRDAPQEKMSNHWR